MGAVVKIFSTGWGLLSGVLVWSRDPQEVILGHHVYRTNLPVRGRRAEALRIGPAWPCYGTGFRTRRPSKGSERKLEVCM